MGAHLKNVGLRKLYRSVRRAILRSLSLLLVACSGMVKAMLLHGESSILPSSQYFYLIKPHVRRVSLAKPNCFASLLFFILMPIVIFLGTIVYFVDGFGFVYLVRGWIPHKCAIITRPLLYGCVLNALGYPTPGHFIFLADGLFFPHLIPYG